MRLRLTTLALAAYLMLPAAVGLAGHNPGPPSPPPPHGPSGPLPCAHCPMDAPELDFAMVASGVALAAGGALFMLERLRRRR
jgi:hypothetical protein